MTRPRGTSRVVLGPRAGVFGILAWLSLATGLCILVMSFARSLIQAGGKELLRTVMVAILPTSVSLSYAMRFLLGFRVELREHELRLYPYGRLWRPTRLPLESILAVEPWREDEPQPEGHGLERSPRLHVQFVGGEGRLFGPWRTRNADADYRRLRDLLGPLFRGEPELRR